MAGKRLPREAGKGAEPSERAQSEAVALAKQCGIIGLTPLEAEAKLGRMDSEDLIRAYQEGRAQHAFSVMAKIYTEAMAGKEKLLLWLAENNLHRNVDAKVGDAVIDAMTPEQRREKIKELTRKLKVG